MTIINKLIWANLIFMHKSPIPGQNLQEITERSFFELTSILKTNSRVKLNLAISGSLLEDLVEHKLELLIEELRELSKKGQVEFVSTATSFALLPKLPKEEIRRQLERNNEISRRILGPTYHPEVVLLPELAYSKDTAEVLTQMGTKWAIVAGTAATDPDRSSIHAVKGLPLRVLFRNDRISQSMESGEVLNSEDFWTKTSLEADSSQYLLTIFDAELFGYVYPGMQKLLAQLYRDNIAESKFLSEIVQEFPRGGEVELVNSSARATAAETSRGAAYGAWQFPGNSIQFRQWQLVNLAIAAVWSLSKMDSLYPNLRERLDRALHSDQFLWAGARPYWNFRLVESCSKELKNIIQESSGASLEDKEEAANLHRQIMELGLQLYGDRVFGVK